MSRTFDPALSPRKGNCLHVVIVARISGVSQDERSLDDQEAMHREIVDSNYDGPIEWRVLATRGSGERLDRDEYFELTELIETGRIDLVIAEDLGRICRRVHAHLLCELCEDHGTRLIALNDHIDTGRPDWRLHSHFAVMRHESYNADTAARIQRSHRNRFRQGGVVQCVIYGIVKPHRGAQDTELSKDPTAEPIYDQWFQKLESGSSLAEVADWLNELSIPTGPHCRNKSWDANAVRRVTFNPILKGIRQRNRLKSKRVNSTGRRKSVRADPSELLERPCPHLAFIEPERYDRVVRMLVARNGHTARKRPNGVDPRQGVPKKRTRWPGQHVRCGICGREFRFGGHGQTDHLVCRGAKEYRCWNAITFDGPSAAAKLAHAIMAEVEQLPGFDDALLMKLRAELAEQQTARQSRLQDFDREQRKLERERDNVISAIREGGYYEALDRELKRIESDLQDLAAERDQLASAPASECELPSIEVIRSQTRELFADLAISSPEFQRRVKRLVPSIEVFPYRLLDGGHPVLRAKVTLDLVATLDVPTIASAVPSLQRVLVVDLFERPQRAAYLQQIVELRKSKTQRATAAELGLAIATIEKAMALQRRMDAAGVSDPYVTVHEPPADYPKLCRHLHRRYRFEPLPGYERPQFPS